MRNFFDTLRGKTVAFIGAGVAHRELILRFAKAGAVVTLCDAKPLETFGPYGGELKALGVRLSLGPRYLDGLRGQDMILRTPGFEFFTPALQEAAREGSQVTSETELFFEHCPCRTVGVTGSDGKTTTTSLIAAMYEADGRRVHLGGNIGRAMLPLVDTIQPTDIAVVELSSFQLISFTTSPDIAVVTNVTPNHLDHHKDMDEYVNAKRNILAWQKPGSTAVLGYENAVTRGMAKDVAGDLRWFSRLRAVDSGAYLTEDGVLCLAEKGVPLKVVRQEEVGLRGVHNIENLLAAFAAVRDEVKLTSMAKVAKEFTGVAHRIEPVRTHNGVQWFNDSIATSPTRVIAGLRSFDQKLILLAGGYDKKVPFDPMVPDVLERVKLLILMGPTADKIEIAVRSAPGFDASGLKVLRAKDLPGAVRLAAQHAQAGDIVSLSPACASFDAYPNFEARGNHFKELVRAL